MEGRLLARARAKQETLRAENRAEEDRRRREIAAKIPEIGRIDTALCANLSEMVRIAMRQSARTAQELEKESLALQEKRSALLVQNGYPKDYLDPIYSCPRCRDTGWTDGKICECVQKLYRAEQTRELAPLLKQGDETFENFRLDYYSPVAPASGVSPRAQMERVLRLCRAYAESFGAQSPNLLFTGEPGLGKTFLSAAIARVVAAKGCGKRASRLVRAREILPRYGRGIGRRLARAPAYELRSSHSRRSRHRNADGVYAERALRPARRPPTRREKDDRLHESRPLRH